ncbi:MAG: hypothetical protein EBY83_02365, partial [Verrucomicrobia bacterium]|nr:hypothetical protein [Verrucomicrobiota bacterium]
MGMTTTGNLTLSSTGTVTQSNLIAATGVELLGTGGIYTLTDTGNAITTLVGNTGTVSFLENSGFDIGTVNTVGMTATTRLTLSSTGSVSQSQAIVTPSLELLGTGGNYTLTNTGNAITTLAGNTGTVSFLENSGFDIGTVNTVGLTTSGNLTLSSTAAVTQSQKIIADGLKLLGTDGNYTLLNTSNAINTLAANTGVISFLENSGFTVGTVLAVDGITTTGNLALSSTGGMTFVKNVSTGGTQIYTGPITLSSQAISMSATNQDITFSGATTTINGYQDLTINAGLGTVNFNGVVGASTNPGTLTITGSTININVNMTAASQIYNGSVVIGADVSLIAMGVATPVTYTYAGNGPSTSLSIGGYLDTMPVSFSLTGAAGGMGGADAWGNGSPGNSTTSAIYNATFSLAAGNLISLAPGAGGANGYYHYSPGAGGASALGVAGSTGGYGDHSYAGDGGGGGGATVVTINPTGSLVTGTLVARGASGGQGATYSSGWSYSGGAGGAGGGTTGYTGSPSLVSSSTSSTQLSNGANGTIVLTQNQGGVITFNGSVDGAHALTVIAATGSGTVNLGTSVGSSVTLSSLITKGATITTAGLVKTSGTQSYVGAALNLSDNTTVTTANSDVIFGQVINGAKTLNINTGSGAVTFNYNVGSSTALASVVITGSGLNTLPASIRTSGGINLLGTAELGNTRTNTLAVNTALTSTANGDITIGNTNGARTLTISNGAGVIDLGILGAGPNLTSLTLLGTGINKLRGGITTTGAIDLLGTSRSTQLFANSTIITTDSNVLGGIVNGGTGTAPGTYDLVINSGSAEITLGNIGATIALKSLTLQGTGVNNTGSITTTGGYDLGALRETTLHVDTIYVNPNTDPVVLGRFTLDNGVTLTLGNGGTAPITVKLIRGVAGGEASYVVINSVSTVLVSETIGVDIGTLTITNSGGTTFAGAVTTGTSVVLTDTTGTIAFNGALTTPTLTTANKAYSLGLNATGTSITNAVNFLNTGTLALGSVLGTQTYTGGLNAAGATKPTMSTLKGTINTTNTAMVFGAITLGENTTLNTNATTTAGDLTLGAVTLAGYTLTLQTGAVAGADITGTTVSGLGTLALQTIGGTASFSGAVSPATLTVAS